MFVRRFNALLWATTLLISSLAAWPALGEPGSSPRTLWLMKLTHGEGFSTAQASTVEQLLLSAFDGTGQFKVVARDDGTALRELEARQTAGCTDDTTCIVDIARSHAIDLVASADIGRLGDVSILTLKVISVKSASVFARLRETVRSEGQIVSATDTIAGDLVTAIRRAEAAEVPITLPTQPVPTQASRDALVAPVPDQSAPSMPPAAVASRTHSDPQPARNIPIAKLAGWASIIAGGVAVVAATVLGVSVRMDSSALRDTPHSAAVAKERMDSVNSRATGANILFGAGGAVAAGGVGLVVLF